MGKTSQAIIGGAVAALVLLATVYPAVADGFRPTRLARPGAPGKTTDIRLMNLGSEPAQVVLLFYNTDGTVAATIEDVLSANKPAAWNQISEPPELPSGWQGSVVVYSSQTLAAIINMDTGSPRVEAASYTGFVAGSTNVYLPAILKNAWSWTTTFAVQNVGSGPTSITVEFRDMSGVVVDTDSYHDVQPGASVYANQADDDELGSFFAGSVAITSDPEPVAAVVNEDSTHYDSMSYNSFTSGSTSLYLPSILKYYFCWSSDIRMMNVGTSSTDATLQFRDLDGHLTYETTMTLGPNQPWATNQHFDANLPNGWAGSVRITTDGEPVVAVVNEAAQDASCGSGRAMAYSGIPAGAAEYSLPSILKNAWGWVTDIRMMNTSSSEVSVTRTYYDMAGATVWSDTQPIPAYGVRAYNQTFEGALGAFFQGSVGLTATGGDIAVIVNEDAPSDDVSMVYNGIPITP